MKILLFLIGMGAAGFLGYSFEPQFRETLTGKTPAINGRKARSTVVATEAPAVEIDLASFSVDQLPEKILLKADAEISDAASNLKMTITAGNIVTLIRLEGSNVIISPGAGPFEGTVPVSQTDLLEQLTSLPKNPTPASAAADPPDMAGTDSPFDEPATPPTAPDLVPEPAAPEPEMAPAPGPEPSPETEPSAVPAGQADVVAVMKESIQSGDIKEFTFDQVLDWQASDGPETIDKVSYQTGIASYEAETVFGVKTIQAKALIKGGKVVRWLWPKSGMEIK